MPCKRAFVKWAVQEAASLPIGSFPSLHQDKQKNIRHKKKIKQRKAKNSQSP